MKTVELKLTVEGEGELILDGELGSSRRIRKDIFRGNLAFNTEEIHRLKDANTVTQIYNILSGVADKYPEKNYSITLNVERHD